MQYPPPAEIVGQLNAIAGVFDGGALAVYSADGKRTVFLPANEPAKVERLTGLMEAGSWPIAFIVLKREGARMDVVCNPLPAVANIRELDEYLAVIAKHFEQFLVPTAKVKPAVLQ